ncbi:BnaA06g20580D [Brassica napus]|uniref:Malate dehydrogenase n=1 Tax=Brassica napus TaxID=3708 RepID=A0A078G8R7_BRANA|nr:unnamed protein product [Brassica napus]CDY21789.1 BnaA06g20580D [Brassica napus]
MSHLVSTLHLYNIANVKRVVADLSLCNTHSQVLAFTGPSELADCLKDVNVMVIPAGVPRKHSMTRNTVNSTVPIAAQVLTKKGVYDPKKLFGVTTLDVVRANTFVSQKKKLKHIIVDVPVIGGHAGVTILPIFSKTKPSASLTDEEFQELTVSDSECWN